MKESFVLGIIQNVAILITFCILYDHFWAKRTKPKNVIFKVIAGVFLAFVVIILILTPWDFEKGIFFDTRSVMLSVAGLFFGPIPTIIGMFITALYRYSLGGSGVIMGIAVILSSGTIGILWNYFRPNWKAKNTTLELTFLGLLVHIIMLLCTMLLPPELILRTFKQIFFPVITLYPLATVLVGNYIIRQETVRRNKKELDESQKLWQYALEGAGDGVWDWNLITNEVFYSKQLKSMLGYDDTEFSNTFDDWKKRVHPDDIEDALKFIQLHIDGKKDFYTSEHRILCKDGSYKWILDRGKIMQYDENRKPLRIIGTHKDISERKAVEVALKNSQEQLKKFAAHLQNVREEERVLLAREIHDELGQILIALKIDLGMLKQKFLNSDTDKKEIELKFEQVIELLNTTIKTTRKIMTGLRPEVLEITGLIETIRIYAKEFENRYKIECAFESGVQDLNIEIQESIALFRILQEALSNVAKHSKATKVTIQLKTTDDTISLEIADNGIGIDSNSEVRKDSYGLIGMRERVLLLNGNLTIEGATEKGTVVKIEMPNRELVV